MFTKMTCQVHPETSAADTWKLTQKQKLDLNVYDVLPQACINVF